ncbi:MAG: Fe-S cluster assembly ATPase SufC [Thaumarchaeota archaeon]|nr:Fe-S cluster assembly ATPase SufC [Candidatus Calditenuaceae archaeon]MDW8187421.1 Fe-S cluster assembly ATPase SufC [Nitrososphaerota archaeon]
MLEIVDLYAGIEGRQILKGLNLRVSQGEVHALMGPNGSGKSTTAYVIMGHPKYQVESGDIRLDGQSILDLTPDQRAKMGIFLAFQYPQEITGITMANFLRKSFLSIYGEEGKKVTASQFQRRLVEHFKAMQFDETFTKRYLNEGFSGGEKKRSEIVQMLTLKPKIAILDETDSGLDIDGVKVVASTVRKMVEDSNIGVLVITHYARILNYLRPDYVHIMYDGRVIVSGGFELAEELERVGYKGIEEKYFKGM